MKITYYGHSCFNAEINGKNILFDPYITPNELAGGINVDEIPADYILLTHGHEDHVADVERIAKRTGATVVGCFEVVMWFNKHKGIEKYHPMNIGGKWMFDFGKVKCVNAVHSSSMPDGSYGGVAMGFLLETSEGNFYYAGDTALHYDMKLIGEYRDLRFAFLPIGDNFTMSVDNALIASDYIRCNKIIGMHYDTFGYIKIDAEEAVRKFTSTGKSLTLMEIGQTLDL